MPVLEPKIEEVDLADYADTGLSTLGTPLLPPRRYHNSLTGTFPLPAQEAAPAPVSAPPRRPAFAADPNDPLLKGIELQGPRSFESNAAALGWNAEELKVQADRGRIERSRTIAATLDMPFSQAYDSEPNYTKLLQAQDPNFFKLAGQSVLSTIGEMYVSAARAAEWAGYGGAAAPYLDYGQKLKLAYQPAVTPKDFTFSRMLEPEWWATSAVSGVTSSLMLAPAAIFTAYGMAVAAPAAGAAMTLGAFGKMALVALGGGAASRYMESAFEAGSQYDKALSQGVADKEAREQADKVFKANLALSGIDVAQFLTAFTPLGRLTGRFVPNILHNRVVAAGVKVGGVGAMEAGEEMIQDAIGQWASTGSWAMTPQMKEAGVLGWLMGAGMGGAGSVWEHMTSHVKQNLPGNVQTQFLEEFQTNLNLGQDQHTAELNALDTISATPEGEQAVKNAVNLMKEAAEGNYQPPTKEDMQQAIDTQQNTELFEGVVPESEIDTLLEPNFDAIASGEISAEQVLGEVVPELATEVAPAEPAPAAAEAPKFFLSEEGYAKHAAAFKEKTSGLHAGFDPTALADLAFMAGYHIERIGRDFAAWSKAVIDEYGDVPADLLKKAWNTAIKYADIGEQAKAKVEGFKLEPLGRTPQQMVKGAIDEHATMVTESTSGLFYKDKAYNRAVKEGNNVRLIGDVSTTLVRGQAILDIVENVPFDIAGEETARPLGEHALLALRIAHEIEGATMPAREVKPQIRLTTGQERIVKMIGEDEALKASFKKAEQAARAAYRAGSKEGMAQAKADMRDVMLKAKVKDEWRGFKMGYQYGHKVTGQELLERFREGEKQNLETRKALAELIKENLPPEMRGKFLDAMVKKLTEKRVNTLLDDINAAAQGHTKQELIDEIAALKVVPGSVDVEYTKRINELLGDINTKRITGKTLQKLENLMIYSAGHGTPSGVSPKMLNDMNRLMMKQAKDMTIEDLRDLRDAAKALTEMGKVKRKLKLRNNERERQKALKPLIADTVNGDMKTDFGNASKFVYNEFLSPFRIAEQLDGYKTRGENFKLVQSLARNENGAQWNVRKEWHDAMTELVAAGITTIDEERAPVIMAHIRMLEGSPAAAQKIIDKYGLGAADPLTAQEEKLIAILEKYTTAHVDELAALYEEITNKPFVRRERYILPLKYEGEFNMHPEEVILQTPHATTQTEQGMTIERNPAGSKKDPRVDVLGVFEQSLNEQQWFLQMQPAIDDVRQLVKTRDYVDKAGAAASEFWTRYLDVVARRGWSHKASHDLGARTLKFFRGNITTAILAYRLSSILMQPFAVVQGMAYASSQWGPTAAARVFAETVHTLLSPGYKGEIVSRSKVLQQRLSAGELSLEEASRAATGGSFKDKFIRSGMGFLQRADVATAAGFQEATRKILESQGVPNAAQEAETYMNLVSSSSDVTARPLFLSRGEGARTLATFQTFTMNAFGLLTHDIVMKGGVKGDLKQRYWALVGLTFLLMGDQAQDWAREFIYETVKRKEKKESKIPLWVRVMFSQAATVPIIGPAFDVAGRHGGGASEYPLIKLITDMATGIKAPFTAGEKTKTEKTMKALFKGAQAGVTLGLGYPGTSQIFDVLEGQLFPEEEKKGRSGFRP